MEYLTKRKKLSKVLIRERERRGLSQQDVANAVDTVILSVSEESRCPAREILRWRSESHMEANDDLWVRSMTRESRFVTSC